MQAEIVGLLELLLYMEILMLSSWNIWKERNMLLFDGITPSTNAWKIKLKANLLLLVHRTKTDIHLICPKRIYFPEPFCYCFLLICVFEYN
jgi:hypothetical protein